MVEYRVVDAREAKPKVHKFSEMAGHNLRVYAMLYSEQMGTVRTIALRCAVGLPQW